MDMHAMGSGFDLAAVHGLDGRESMLGLPMQYFRSAVTSWDKGRRAIRSPLDLRPHPALDELGFLYGVEELSEATKFRNQFATEPILASTCGIILAGFGPWRLAVLERAREIDCIEYSLDEQESLQFILNQHKTRRGWNAFIRICLALTLEPYLQEKALDNMRAGGKYKGLANLPEAQHVDVRLQIADAAGVGTRNVSNVKAIQKSAHPRLIAALLGGTLSINAAVQLCKLPRDEQLEHLIRRSEARETGKVIRQAIDRSKRQKSSPDAASVLDRLQRLEARRPGTVKILTTPHVQGASVLVGQQVLADRQSQDEVECHDLP